MDKIETLPDNKGHDQNLNLTYGVRDGIICHCGEVSDTALVPRDEAIDLNEMIHPSQYPPFTWEGCVMKIADKIAFLGRDLEDAVSLGILSEHSRRSLSLLLGLKPEEVYPANLPNTLLISNFTEDLLQNSSPEVGIRFSPEMLKFMRDLGQFSYDNIYDHPRLKPFAAYASLLLDQLYKHLAGYYAGSETCVALEEDIPIYPTLHRKFAGYLRKYSTLQRSLVEEMELSLGYAKLYDLSDEMDYKQAIIDYLSGMTDHFAIRSFQELLSM